MEDIAKNQSHLQRELRRRMSLLNMTPRQLSLAVGTNDSLVKSILSGKSESPRYDTLQKLASALGCTPADLAGEESPAGTSAEPSTVIKRKTGMLSIDELDVRAGQALGGQRHEGQDLAYDHETVVAQWELPSQLVRAYTAAPAPMIKIITAVGDSNKPEIMPGERVMVDLSDRNPSPPGFFVVWDGFGDVIKRLEMVPYSDPPRVLMKSANPSYEPRELAFDELIIHGRMIGKWQWT
jgi:phage repressor protein C with HTH and peptisase S24 domain